MNNSENVERFEEQSYEPEEENNGDLVMVSSIVKENPYIRKIIKNSKFHVIHEKNVIEAFVLHIVIETIFYYINITIIIKGTICR